MRPGELIDNLPVEEWAASVAKFGRRVRRRVLRRPGTAALMVAMVGVGLAIQLNALLRQSDQHPAPFWGDKPAHVAVLEELGDPAQSSDLVAQIQTALLQESTPTGVLDRRTEAEIRRFEEARGLPVTGRPSVGLMTALEDAGPVPRAAVPAPQRAPAQRPVTPDLDVAALQALLNARGYGPLVVDGLMGPRTREALAAFAKTDDGQNALPAAALALVPGDA